MINNFYDLMKTTNKINLNIITKAFELYVALAHRPSVLNLKEYIYLEMEMED